MPTSIGNPGPACELGSPMPGSVPLLAMTRCAALVHSCVSPPGEPLAQQGRIRRAAFSVSSAEARRSRDRGAEIMSVLGYRGGTKRGRESGEAGVAVKVWMALVSSTTWEVGLGCFGWMDWLVW